MQQKKLFTDFRENMKISPVIKNYINFNQQSNKPKNYTQSATNTINLNNLYFRDYLMFTSRVDKSLKRFYQENKDRMPITLRQYIESLPENSTMEPIEAQFNAFEGLLIAENVQDVKDYFEDEPLFQNLIPYEKTKATCGFLYELKFMKPILEEEGATVLQSGEDFSVYLLKKIFLEAKSLTEINNDLDEDLNPVFKKDTKNYMTYASLKSLGINLPNADFLTSLRYTKPGYSDEMGKLMSAALLESNSKLTPEQRAERFKRNCSPLRKFWEEISEEDAQAIYKKNSEAQKERWVKLSIEERSKIIEGLQKNHEFQRYLMINTWNHCDDIRFDLSDFFKKHNINASIDETTDGTQGYSEYLSKIMVEFWETYPQHSIKIGNEMLKSHELLIQAKNNGTYEELIKEILKAKNERKIIRQDQIDSTEETITEVNKPSAIEEFKTNFKKECKTTMPYIPKDFIDLFLDNYVNNLRVEELDYANDLITSTNMEDKREIIDIVFSREDNIETFRAKRSMEEAIARVLYDASDKKNADVFNQFFKDINSTAIDAYKNHNYPERYKIQVFEEKEPYITLVRRPNFSRIQKLYRDYNKPAQEFIVNNMLDSVINLPLAAKIQAESSGKLYSALRFVLEGFGKTLTLDKHEKDEEINGNRVEKLMYYTLFHITPIDESIVDNITEKLRKEARYFSLN